MTSKTPRTQWAPGAPALADAARAISAVVFDGHTADIALLPFAQSTDRAAVRAITLGCLRWFLRLAPAVESLLARPEGVANEVRCLLIATAHQIEYSRNPAETNANAAVDAVRLLGHEKAAGLVNAVLRRFVAERVTLLVRGDADIAVRTAHPRWFVDAIEKAWPEQAVAILEANNAHPPMVLRVDLTRVSVPDYLADLAAAGIPAHALDWAPAAVELEKPVGVGALPGFHEGRVSVQDAGAQLAVQLLDARAGMRVLDACAAPGGKTGHLLERTPDLAELIAVDSDRERLTRVRDNLKRLKRNAITLVGDVRDPTSFWDGKPFDRVLLDAPCSSTGVIRRHPDIKLLRREGDVAPLAAAQLGLLRAAFAMLKPGGRLIYSTCSVLPAENEEVVARFLKAESEAKALPLSIRAPGAQERTLGTQLLPGAEAAATGFYYAGLEKTTIGN